MPIIFVEKYKLLVALLEYFTINSENIDLGKLWQILHGYSIRQYYSIGLKSYILL